MATRGERIFSLVGVVVALLSASALTIAVIVSQKMQDDAAASQAALSCTTDSTPEQTFPVPATYTTKQTPTSVQSTDITVGSGPGAKSGDCLVVKYYGTLADTGVKFDENFTSTQGFEFKLGAGQVIKGWDLGLVGMKAGGERRLVIPAEQAYGSQGSGTIPPNAVLVFDVRLLRFQ